MACFTTRYVQFTSRHVEPSDSHVRTYFQPLLACQKFDIMQGTKSRFAENKFLDTAIVAAYFQSPKTGIGFEYPAHFKPMPEPAIAFILTVVRALALHPTTHPVDVLMQIHAHILEWSSGQRVVEQFTETANSGFYTGFCTDLESYGSSNATAWLNIRKCMFERTL